MKWSLLPICLFFPTLCTAQTTSDVNSQVASDSNVAAKLTGNLVPHSQTGKSVRTAPSTPCSSSEANVTTSGTPGVLYDLFIQLQDVTVDTPPDAITFSIDYERATKDKGLEIVAWESLVGVQIQHPSANGEDWPAPGSSITLVIGGERPVTRSSLDAVGRGTRALGRFLVQANGDALMRFTTDVPAADGMGSTKAPIEIHDPTGFQSLASPDHLGQIAFGQAGRGYDPCQGAGSETKATEVLLGPQRTLTVMGQRNPFERRVEWTVMSSKVRFAKVALYSVSGRVVKRWESIQLGQGETKVVWDGQDESGAKASSGVYYLEVTSSDGYRVVTKAILVRQ
jgi:hypothetical protein